MSDIQELPPIRVGDTEIPFRTIEKGRRKGKDLSLVADEIGVNPFEILLYAAGGLWQELGLTSPTITKVSAQGNEYEVEALPIELRIAAAKEACQYLHPKKRAIEHSGSDDAPPIKFDGSYADLVKLARG